MSYAKTYHIADNNLVVLEDFTCGFLPLFIKDEDEKDANRLKRLEFHIRSNDYFGTTATILSYIAQVKGTNQECGQVLDKLKNDLLYLQEKYKIVKK